MRKQTLPKTAPHPEEAPERPEALDPSELEATAAFEPLPQDLAPTQLVPESGTPPPELRTMPIETELSTLAMPTLEPRPLKTADIPPALLPGAAPSTRPKHSWVPWLVAGVAALVLAGAGAAWYVWPRLQPGARAGKEASAAIPASQPVTQEPVPPELRPYLAQAQSGDAKAMHMIALMYWNGLNVRQDRVKGLAWYRKAAAAGSTAAQETLKTIEGK